VLFGEGGKPWRFGAKALRTEEMEDNGWFGGHC